MDKSLKNKLILRTGIILFLSFVISIIAVFQIVYIQKKIKKITDIKEPSSASAYQMEINTISVGLDVLGYLNGHNPNYLISLRENENKFYEFQKIYNELTTTPEEIELAKKVEYTYSQFSKTAWELIKLYNFEYSAMDTLDDRFENIDDILDEEIEGKINPNEKMAFQKLHCSVGMENNANEIFKNIQIYLKNDKLKNRRKTFNDEEDFEGYLKNIKTYPLNKEKRYWIKKIEEIFRDNQRLIRIIFEKHELLVEKKNSFIKLIEDLDTMLDDEVQIIAHEHLLSSKNEAIQVAKSSLIVIILVLIVTMLFGLLTSISTIRSITKPINSLVLATNKVAEGDLSTNIESKSSDELGYLANSFNAMVGRLKETTVSKDYVENILYSMDEMLIVVTVEGIIQTVNKSALNTLEYNNSELIGSYCSLFLKNSETLITEVMNNPYASFSTIETFYKTKSNKLIPISLSRSLMKNNNDSIRGVILIAVDITQKKINEQALARSRERYLSLVNNAPFGIWTYSHKGEVIFANEKALEIFNLSKASEILGLFDNDRNKKFIQSMDEAFAGEILTNYHSIDINVKKGKDKTDKIKHLHSTIYPLSTQIGEKPDLVIIQEDVTEQIKSDEEKNKLEEQLRQSQKMETVGTMAGGIAHDFNNLLTPIIGYTNLIIDQLPKEDQIRKRLEHVLKAGNRAKDLVHQILTFSRRVGYERKPINLSLIIQEALNLLKTSVPHYIEVKKYIQPNCGSIFADASQIHQVFMNLCTNAIHAMNNNSSKENFLDIYLNEVALDSNFVKPFPKMEAGEYLCMIISDTGTGMSREITDKIFEPFFTTKKLTEGTGLGLSVAHGIISAHGGTISVESKLNVGTKFFIYLPKLGAKIDESDVADEKIKTGSERILIVDDEEEITTLLQTMLEPLGYKVTVYTDSQKAFEKFSESSDDFDLLITDQTMPNMSGVELVDKIRTVKKDFPALLVTGFSSEKIEINNAVVLIKPLDSKVLTNSMRQLLDKN